MNNFIAISIALLIVIFLTGVVTMFSWNFGLFEAGIVPKEIDLMTACWVTTFVFNFTFLFTKTYSVSKDKES